MGGVAAGQPQPPQTPALDRGNRKHQGGAGRVGVRVSLMAERRRLLDKDNNVASFKPLQDAIAKTLAIDDGAAAIDWEYGQKQTNGAEGVIVKVQFV